MEDYDQTFNRGRKLDFDQTPSDSRLRLFDVDYVYLRGMQSGELFVTRLGWPVVECLAPRRWFVGQRFNRVGRALAGATGAVYRVPVEHPHASDFALVVKFCRFGQDALVTAVDPVAMRDPNLRFRFTDSEFLSPFEEFGNVMSLRQTTGRRVRTQRPLAIYVPPTRYLPWELGRKSSMQNIHSVRLLKSQAHQPPHRRLDYDWERTYVLIYGWINGIDVLQAARNGVLTETDVKRLTNHARQTLLEQGWVVVDHKPTHVIVRPAPDGKGIIHHRDDPLWAVVDYELLFPI